MAEIFNFSNFRKKSVIEVGATNKIKKEKNYRKGRYTMEHF